MKQKKRTFLFFTLSDEAALDRLRLFGYGIFGLCAVAVTTLLVAGAQGYDIDRSTGEIIQNGLVLVDAVPEDAQIYIDGADEQDRTPGRFALPSGQHTVRLERNGYLNWTKEVTLTGSDVEWLYYPRLFPEVTTTNTINNYSTISDARQSPDKRWLLLQTDITKPAFELYDLDSESLLSSTISIPDGALSVNEDAETTFEIIEWSQNSDFFIVKQTTGEVISYIVANRAQPRLSFNITERSGLLLRNVHFRGDNTVLFYANINGSVRQLDGRDGSVSAPLLSNVVYYEPVGNDRLLYVQEKANRTTLEAGVLEGKEAQFLYTFLKPASEYFLQLETYESKEYVAVGSSAQSTVTIVGDPLNANRSTTKDTISIRLNARPTMVSFAPGNQFIAAQQAGSMQVYDLEEEMMFEWSFDGPVEQASVWMDSHYLVVFDSFSVGHIAEFDGANSTTIGRGIGTYGAFFDRSLELMLSIDQSSEGQSLSRTNLLTEADAQ